VDILHPFLVIFLGIGQGGELCLALILYQSRKFGYFLVISFYFGRKNSLALPPMQLFWRFSIHEQLADWSTFPCGSQFGIVLPSQLVQLWLSFAQQLVG
jgi:hypothetical protein